MKSSQAETGNDQDIIGNESFSKSVFTRRVHREHRQVLRSRTSFSTSDWKLPHRERGVIAILQLFSIEHHEMQMQQTKNVNNSSPQRHDRMPGNASEFAIVDPSYASSTDEEICSGCQNIKSTRSKVTFSRYITIFIKRAKDGHKVSTRIEISELLNGTH